MPVQLPRDLGIAHLVEIQIPHLEPGLSGGPFSVNDIEMPVDFRSEVEILVPHEVKSVQKDFLSSQNDLSRGRRESLMKQRKQGVKLLAIEKEITLPG